MQAGSLVVATLGLLVELEPTVAGFLLGQARSDPTKRGRTITKVVL